MAAKKALKATAIPQVPVEFNLKMDINKEDIVSIGVAEYEDELRNQMSELTKERKSLNKQIADKIKAIEDACIKTAKSAYDSKLAAVQKALGDLDVKVDPWITSAEVTELTIRRKKAPRIIALVSLFEDKRKAWLEELPPIVVPAAIKKFEGELKTLKELLAENNSSIAQIHSDIADIPTYIRRVRAEVARRAMESTTEGRALLGTVMGAPKQARLNG